MLSFSSVLENKTDKRSNEALKYCKIDVKKLINQSFRRSTASLWIGETVGFLKYFNINFTVV